MLTMDVSPQAIGVGAGIAASALLWWLLRGRVVKSTLDPSSTSPASYKTPVAKVTKLCVYPVKSCHRIEVESSYCFKRGFKYDRCWVIIGKDGSLCNQRRQPIMAQIQPELTFLDDARAQLTLNAPGMSKLVLYQPPDDSKTTPVKVWSMSGEGVDMGEEAGQWVSKFLDEEGCKLFFMGPQQKGRVLKTDPRWSDFALIEEETSFADCSPILIASEASLELLNSKVDDALPMERFRPNIVVSGCLPHSEDNWGTVRVGEEVILRGLKPCGRCKMTTVEPEEGRFTGEEPLKTLREYRLHETVFNCPRDPRFGQCPLFGYNLCVLRSGIVRVGDILFVR